MSNYVLRTIHIADKFMKVFSVLILGEMTLFVFAQVLAKYVFKPSLAWPKEGARFMSIWVTFIARYVGARKGQHIGVKLTQGLFPESAKTGIKMLCDSISIGFFILVLFYCCVQQDKLSTQISPALKIPMAFAYLGIILGCFGMAASYPLYIFEVLRKRRGEEA